MTRTISNATAALMRRLLFPRFSRQARRRQGYCEGDRGPRKPTQSTLEGREQCVLVELSERPIVEAERAVDAGDVTPDETRRRAEGALRVREREGTKCPSDCGDIEASGLCGVAGQQRERTPRRGEADVGVHASAEDLEVVCDDEDRPGDDERKEHPSNP